MSGDAPRRIAGDSCARTTWENATRTFARQGLQAQPLAAEPPLSAPERNHLALREAAATLLYRPQGHTRVL